MATAIPRRPSGPVLSISHYRSASPTRVKLSGSGGRASVSVSSSPAAGARASVSVSSSLAAAAASRSTRRSCMCSPTNHAGSFRCSLHKDLKVVHSRPASPPSPSGGGCRLGAKRMGSELARIGAVDGGQCARRALADTARPSQHRRRVGAFRSRPSRLSAVSVAGDRAGDDDRQ